MPLVEDADKLAVGGLDLPAQTSPSDDTADSPATPDRPSLPGKQTTLPHSHTRPITIPAPSPSSSSSSPYYTRRVSEESIRTELCEGLLLDPLPVPTLLPATLAHAQQQQLPLPELPLSAPRTPVSRELSAPVTDRAELIERLKRGESPTWVPNRRLESMFQRRSRSPTPSPRSASTTTASTPPPTAAALLPAVDITSERISPPPAHNREDGDVAARLREGLDLERPRSALHSGDFTATGRAPPRDDHRLKTRLHSGQGAEATATATPTPAPGRTAAVEASARDSSGSSTWLATSPPRDFLPFAHSLDHRSFLPLRSSLAELGIFSSPSEPGSGHVVSPSLSSLSTSFVYKPPTSPLVQSQSHTDDDADNAAADDDSIAFPMSDLDVDLGYSPTRHPRWNNVRRHTLAYTSSHGRPLSFYPQHTARLPPPPPPLPAAAGARRDSLFPYQAHQPRRSLSSVSNHNPFRPFPAATTAASTPQTPTWSRTRRVSFSSDATSPLQHASMVGSYEESILRGRMSTTPSKPLDFLAQIGVLGLGPQCKPSLRCPPHVTIPFAAVFYSYHDAAATAHARSKTDDSPSPYVGSIDLENGLPNPEAEQRSRRKAALSSRRATSQAGADSSALQLESAAAEDGAARQDVVMQDADAEDEDDAAVPAASSSSRPRRRHPSSPKAPPGGSYRIPEKGQLQIIIKNQNKTAVKLFLVPYDLTGMEPGTKTFIRQRSYSAPVVEGRPAASASASSAASHADRPVLRYLVHLHICCPARGRHYLYRSIRVVFANRVPDDKETLRNEATFPEPRYSPYKPVRTNPPVPVAAATSAAAAGGSSLGGGGGGAVEQVYRRRRSSALSFADTLDAFGIRHGGGAAAVVGGGAPPGRLASSPLSTVPGSFASLSFSPLPAPLLPSDADMGTATAPPVFGLARSGGAGGSGGGRNAPVDAIPQTRASSPALSSSSPLSSSASQQTSRPSSGHAGACRVDTEGDSERQRQATVDGPSLPADTAFPWSSSLHTFRKLRRGDVGYGGHAFVASASVPGGPAAAAEGLLSQRLRSLDVRKTRAGRPDEETEASRSSE